MAGIQDRGVHIVEQGMEFGDLFTGIAFGAVRTILKKEEGVGRIAAARLVDSVQVLDLRYIFFFQAERRDQFEIIKMVL